MENNYFITDEPNELVAYVSYWGKLDWNNGYGKYLVAIILLFAAYHLYETGLPFITSDNWPGALVTYWQYVFPLAVAFDIYRSSYKTHKNLLVINSKGILCNEETFYWDGILSFQVSLEKELKKQNHNYYLHLVTKNKVDRKINISMYNKKFDEIHRSLIKNAGRNEVKDLGFTQII
jgi:hypothetical protein